MAGLDLITMRDLIELNSEEPVIVRGPEQTIVRTPHFSAVVQGKGHKVYTKVGKRLGVDLPDIRWVTFQIGKVKVYTAGNHLTMTEEDLCP